MIFSKFNFLNIKPIAIKNIADNISSGFVVLDGNNDIVNFNKEFAILFKDAATLRKGAIFLEFIESEEFLKITSESFLSYIENSKLRQAPISIERTLEFNGDKLYYLIKFAPIVH